MTTTTTAKRLGRLEKVVLREVWGNNTQEFVGWLRQPDNISFLGNALGMNLQVTNVGNGTRDLAQADITCHDSNGTPVFVKVQFDQTSDDQLGQVLVAARNSERAVIIWIADRVAEPHRDVLEWFNRITADSYRFYGMEVDFWRIGESSLAPTVTVVVAPEGAIVISTPTPEEPEPKLMAPANEPIQEPIQSAPAVVEDADLSHPTSVPATPFLEYWLAFNGHLLQRKSSVIGQKPTHSNWMSFPIGGPYYYLVATVSPRDHFVAVGLVLSGTEAKRNFQFLQQARVSVEQDVGTALEWLEVPDKSEYRILVRRYGFDPNERPQWEQQHAWLAERLERFQRAFSVRVEAMQDGAEENGKSTFATVTNISATKTK